MIEIFVTSRTQGLKVPRVHFRDSTLYTPQGYVGYLFDGSRVPFRVLFGEQDSVGKVLCPLSMLICICFWRDLMLRW